MVRSCESGVWWLSRWRRRRRRQGEVGLQHRVSDAGASKHRADKRDVEEDALSYAADVHAKHRGGARKTQSETDLRSESGSRVSVSVKKKKESLRSQHRTVLSAADTQNRHASSLTTTSAYVPQDGASARVRPCCFSPLFLAWRSCRGASFAAAVTSSRAQF